MPMPLRVHRPFLALLCAAAAAQSVPTAPTGSPAAVPAPAAVCALFAAAAGTLQDLAVPRELPVDGAEVEIVLGGRTCTLWLLPHDVRARGYRLLVADAAGVHAEPSGPVATARGGVRGEPDSRAAATVLGDGLLAVVRSGGELYAVEPLRHRDPTAPAGRHFVSRAADGTGPAIRCGVTAGVPVPHANTGPDVLFACELACEADLPFFQRNGSNAVATQNDVLGVVNAVDAIYQADVDIAFTVTTVLVRTAADPYTTADPNGLLAQFTQEWSANQGAIVRDTAHLFTDRPMLQTSGGVIGIATLGSVCQPASAYGVSQSLYGGGYAQRVGLTAHEIGHNFGASHCDGTPDCRIMCAYLGGCSGNLGSFSNGERAQITGFRNTCTCLAYTPGQPQVATVAPASVHGLATGVVTLTGSGFLGTTRVDVGSASLQPGQFVVADDTQLRFLAPLGLPIGQAPVTVTNPTGSSNAAPFAYTAASPPELDAPAGAIGGFVANFSFAGGAGDVWFLVVGLQGTTAPWLGWPLLQGSSALAVGAFGPGGVGGLSVPVPPAVLNGVTVWSQVVDATASLQMAGTSPVRSTRVFL